MDCRGRAEEQAEAIREAVILGVDGISDFDALHSGRHNDEVQLCAFDILAEGGDDLRKLPLSMRKANLERLLARRRQAIFVNPFERGEIGPDLFRAACRMGLEGLVSKRMDRPDQAGRSKHWVKIKNRSHPAMDRVAETFRQKSESSAARRATSAKRHTSGLTIPSLMANAHLVSVKSRPIFDFF
jgi:ATP-dependent DNA ligase